MEVFVVAGPKTTTVPAVRDRSRRLRVGFVGVVLAFAAVLGQFGLMSADPVQAYNLLPWRWQPRSSAISWDYSCNAPWGPGGGCANWVQPQQQPAWQYWTNRTVDAANRW